MKRKDTKIDSESDPKVASSEESTISPITLIQIENTAVRTMTNTTTSTSIINCATTTSSSGAL
jgi:hypothetical protein